MRYWWQRWIVGVRFRINPETQHYEVRSGWRKPWRPLRLRKVMGPVQFTDEVLDRMKDVM